ncbi:hypothetical protein [Janibacter sp. GS2]|uniref:hypothetical protein n=1 Tax=Janibacter sp. GS2 TaxID=3442646 RepID=UPI003EC0365C
MNSEITSPSRRQIAKGAAWAVPAVAVAAAAPSLAASTCPPPVVAVNCPPLLTTQQLTFTITNPSSSTCDLPEGEVITVDRGGLAGVQVGPLNDLNVGVELLFTDANTAELTAPLAPGESITFQVFPRGLATVSALQNVTVAIQGASATQGYTIISLLGLSVAICGLG